MQAKFTATEQRILVVLSDGNYHKPAELFKCLNDELQPIKNVKVHLSNIRKKLRPMGHDIVYLLGQGYKHVRIVSISE